MDYQHLENNSSNSKITWITLVILSAQSNIQHTIPYQELKLSKQILLAKLTQTKLLALRI